MRITEIALTNFRSFQVTQSIALAPVTLLFGPNSVGKSSVLMALFYIQQMLEKGQCDPSALMRWVKSMSAASKAWSTVEISPNEWS